MNLHVWLAFVAASIILLAIPGPTALIVICTANGGSPARRLKVIVAAVLGDLVAITLCGLGLGTMLLASSNALWLLKIASSIYLMSLGVWSWRTDGTGTVESGGQPLVFARVFLTSALNPKALVFFCAFLPQFIDGKVSLPPQLAILEATFCCISFLGTSLWAILGASLFNVRFGGHIRRWSARLTGGILIGAGLGEAFALGS